MNFHILNIPLSYNTYVALQYGLIVFRSLLFIMILLLYVIFNLLLWLDFIVQFSPFYDDFHIQSELCGCWICVLCVCVCVCVGGKTSRLISDYHNYFDYDNHCNRCQRNTSQCHLPEQFIWQQDNPLVKICYCGKCFIFHLLYNWEVSVCPTSGLTGLSECSRQSNVSNITFRVVTESHWHMQ
jgi:hypothetical protein